MQFFFIGFDLNGMFWSFIVVPLYHFSDVNILKFEELDKNKEILLCKADTVGKMMQVNTDGYSTNKRHQLAMGLASIHIAQLLEVGSSLVKISKHPPVSKLEFFTGGLQGLSNLAEGAISGNMGSIKYNI